MSSFVLPWRRCLQRCTCTGGSISQETLRLVSRQCASVLSQIRVLATCRLRFIIFSTRVTRSRRAHSIRLPCTCNKLPLIALLTVYVFTCFYMSLYCLGGLWYLRHSAYRRSIPHLLVHIVGHRRLSIHPILFINILFIQKPSVRVPY